MKKTILILAACMLMASGLLAETRSSNNLWATTHVVEVELSTFCRAIMQGDIDTVKRLIELGADVNKKSLGMTPVIFAARYNKAEVLKLLISNGADLTKKCNKGWAIQKHAKLSNAQDVLAILKESI